MLLFNIKEDLFKNKRNKRLSDAIQTLESIRQVELNLYKKVIKCLALSFLSMENKDNKKQKKISCKQDEAVRNLNKSMDFKKTTTSAMRKSGFLHAGHYLLRAFPDELGRK